ncbi:hypothetical protein GSH05_07580 [Burkholderia pseudomallei]|uniref:Uncharacterized protein n=1 Tax=Burkholderia pseudomallei TaxID=28450 RepID=A0AAX0UFD1_BURPE|nr:hypothetical protein CXQ84_32485 [Burkholderia pseudomallei]PNX05320.1 hypothetical protein CF649_04630 [Burkholderia sp. 136(2017)]PNX18119.1 hypothetical protein CF650_01860 [Burkholderia sp. 129]PNX32223.1 hypothetical protein CF647_04535 [Burkholderia sp. 117]PNX41180.1 hypothetical protein CF648_04630 [Burkholderia sp. 137]
MGDEHAVTMAPLAAPNRPAAAEGWRRSACAASAPPSAALRSRRQRDAATADARAPLYA